MSNKVKKIAILGATGYIGQSLIHTVAVEKGYKFFLYTRSQEKLKFFLQRIKKKNTLILQPFDEWSTSRHDAIINCVGMGNPKQRKEAGISIFHITEKLDDLILTYLEKHPHTLYINLSSGAVYGRNTMKPAEADSYSSVAINALDSSDFYTIAKVNSEAKHRALPALNIVDIRIFSFFSRFIDLTSGYLMAEIVSCLQQKKRLFTRRENLIRDYIITADLWQFMKLLIRKGKLNNAYDLYSAQPVSKIELLRFMKKKYGLMYSFRKTTQQNSQDIRSQFYSKNRKAEEVGYSPKFTSLEGIENELLSWKGL